jgi:hypothetical protein
MESQCGCRVLRRRRRRRRGGGRRGGGGGGGRRGRGRRGREGRKEADRAPRGGSCGLESNWLQRNVTKRKPIWGVQPKQKIMKCVKNLGANFDNMLHFLINLNTNQLNIKLPPSVTTVTFIYNFWHSFFFCPMSSSLRSLRMLALLCRLWHVMMRQVQALRQQRGPGSRIQNPFPVYYFTQVGLSRGNAGGATLGKRSRGPKNLNFETNRRFNFLNPTNQPENQI